MPRLKPFHRRMAVVLGTMLSASAASSAQLPVTGLPSTTPARRWAFESGLGLMGTGNYRKDMRDHLAADGYTVSGGAAWINLGLACPIRLYGPVYVVPGLTVSVSEIKTTTSGFEYAPNESGTYLVQYGAGLRYYVRQTGPGNGVFLQASERKLAGSSDIDGFPVKAKGLASEIAVGLEVPITGRRRLAVDLGYAVLPINPPLDSAYMSSYNAPSTALGGNYGGLFVVVTFAFWQ